MPPKHPAMQALANTFERALVTMHKMPRVWLMYLQVTQQAALAHSGLQVLVYRQSLCNLQMRVYKQGLCSRSGPGGSWRCWRCSGQGCCMLEADCGPTS
jgi:hypothetical protein